MSNLHYIQVPLGRLPLHLVCLSNGCVAIVIQQSPFNPFRDLLDLSLHGVSADFSTTGFRMYRGDESEEYGYGQQIEYKQQPLLLKWLQQQELEMPEFSKEKN